jgi:putative inorganic carbon (HCO3(-)) transporter
VLVVAVVVVPSLFTTRVADVFVLPKLTALWAVFALAFAAIGLAVIAGRSIGAPLRWEPAVDLPAVAFLVLHVAAAWASTDQHQSLFGERYQYQGLLTTVLYAGFFGLTRCLFADPRRLEALLVALVAGATIVSGYAVAQKAGHDPFWDILPDGRVFSTFGQSNALGAYLVLAVAPAIRLAIRAAGAARALAAAAAVMIVSAIVLTQSRGALIALGVLTLVVAWHHNRGRPRLRWAAVAALLCVVVVVLVVAPLRRVGDEALDDLSARGAYGHVSVDNHLDAWAVAVRIAAENPLLGTGQETFPDVFPRYSREVLPADRVAYFDQYRVESAHNVYLNIAATTGVPALVAYVTLVVGVLVVTMRAARTAEPAARGALLVVALAVVGHLVTDAFMSPEITGTWITWMLAGSAVGIASAQAALTPARTGSR